MVQQQLHLSPLDIKVSFVSNVLLNVVLCTILKPNGNSVWVEQTLKESNVLNASVFSEVAIQFSVVYIYFVLNSAQSSGKKAVEM